MRTATEHYLNIERTSHPLVPDTLPYGTPSTEYGALSYAPVYRALEMISGDVSTFPLELQERRPGGGWDVFEGSPIHRLVNRRPSTMLGVTKFWRRLMIQALLWRNAYVLIHRDAVGRPRDLTLLESAYMRYGRDTDTGALLYVYSWPSAGLIQPYFPADILHIEGVHLHQDDHHQPPTPPALVELMRTTLSLGLGAEQFGSEYFNHGGRLGGLLEIPPGVPKDIGDSLYRQFQDMYDRRDAAFKTVRLDALGTKYTPVSTMSARDTQMVETRDETKSDVALWFGLRPHQLGVRGVQSSYNSLSQETRAYFQQTLAFWLEGIADECEAKLLPLQARLSGRLRFKHRITPFLMSGDISDVVATGERFTNGGLGTLNEYREWMGLNPVENGDELRAPVNSQLAEQMGEDDEQQQQPAPVPVPSEPKDPEDEREPDED